MMKPFCLLYFGADASFGQLENSGFSRRNTNLLNAFTEHPEVTLNVNIQFHTRGQWLKSLLLQKKTTRPATSLKVIDFGAVPLVPIVLPRSTGLNRILNRFRIQRTIGRTDCEVISWCYWPRGYWERKQWWNKGWMVFDADHNSAEDPHLSDSRRRQQQDLLRAVGDDAHAITSSSRTMNRWFDQNDKVHLLMNGVDSARFNHLSKPTTTNPPVIGYIGSLSKWMEIQWLKRLATNHPEWKFRIDGVNHQTNASEELSNLNNVELCGKIAFYDVPSFIESLSMGLILYQPLPAIDVNSMKIYEYLAGHRPVIALENHPNVSSDFNGLLTTVTSFDEFEAAVIGLIRSPKSQEWHTKVDKLLKGCQWANRADEAVNIIHSMNHTES